MFSSNPDLNPRDASSNPSQIGLARRNHVLAFPLFLVVTVTLPSVCLQFNPQPLEELGSDIGIQVFHQIVKSRPQDNIVCLPPWDRVCAGDAAVGADGRTKAQLTSVMRYGVKGAGKTLKKINKAIVSKKNKDIVTVANAMFVKNGSKIELPFITRNKDVFQCEVRSTNLLSPDLIDGVLTRMVLVNALYFKGLWKSRFRPENTKKRPFVAADGKSYQVPMLAQLSLFRSGSASTHNGLWYNFIELPYHGESISMLIALPSESSTPLSAIIPHISTKTIDSWTSMMVPKRVQVVLPNTGPTCTHCRRGAIGAGTSSRVRVMAGIISGCKWQLLPQSPLRNRGSENLHISHILQKAKIEVSEDGTKASAVTTAILIARSSPPWFIVDRPFLFFIRHNPTGAFLFMGQINKP
ncbi:hypothetical protein QTO34_002724 [Cnephaeus nilssonii]|uniref:Serpin domain-containing protein n=1 Tax=Cnephaeus nilssonii TaxID=3371016 RepID=A0AA40LKW0_CNENI|nr:hypothetical protein QTO34_002724 [Eptesicus nilssonii]